MVAVVKSLFCTIVATQLSCVLVICCRVCIVSAGVLVKAVASPDDILSQASSTSRAFGTEFHRGGTVVRIHWDRVLAKW